MFGGSLNDTRDIAFTPSGHLVVLSGTHDRVDVFHPNGSFEFSFGPYDTGGSFSSPTAVAVGPSGQIAVTDAGYDNVQVFHPNGSFDFKFGEYGSVVGRFVNPTGVAIDPTGMIAVSDESKRVQVFHPNGDFAYLVAPPGRAVDFPRNPYDIDFSRDGWFATGYGGSCWNRDGYVFYPNGTVAFRHCDSGDVAFGPHGLVATAGSDRVIIYNADGSLNSTFTSWSGRTDHFRGVTGVDFDPSGRLAVADYNRIVLFNITSVTTAAPWLYGRPPPPPPQAGFHLPGDLAPARDSRIPLSLAAAAPAFVFGSYGEGPGEFLAPRNIAFGPGGVIAVSDAENNRVQLFHPNGTFALELGSRGSGLGELIGPYGLAFGPNGLLAVSDVGNHRVQVFRIQ